MLARRLFNFPSMGWNHPFTELERMSRQMDRLTSGLFGRPNWNWRPARVFPAINLTEDKENYFVRAELPGFKADALDIKVAGRNLSITGERRISPEGENIKFHRQERDAGKFSRVIGLPGDIDPGKVVAKMANGVLTITIAKSEAAKPKQITVN